MDTNERIEIQRLIDRLGEFIALHSDCTARQISAFLVVALNPGINVTELAKRYGVSLATSSRNYKAFGVEALGEKGLVASGYADGRTKALLLTDNGRRMVRRLAQRPVVATSCPKEGT